MDQKTHRRQTRHTLSAARFPDHAQRAAIGNRKGNVVEQIVCLTVVIVQVQAKIGKSKYVFHGIHWLLISDQI